MKLGNMPRLKDMYDLQEPNSPSAAQRSFSGGGVNAETM